MPPIPAPSDVLSVFGTPIPWTTGNDDLTGTSSNPVLFGGAGDDTLYGGIASTGTTVLIGGTDNDMLRGSDGRDIFLYLDDFTAPIPPLPSTPGDPVSFTVISPTEGTDWIENFNADQGDIILTTKLGTNEDDGLVGNSGNNFMNGLAGGDTLYGLDGDDILVGEAGNDVLDGGNGNDILMGGSGANQFLFQSDIYAIESLNYNNNGIPDLIVYSDQGIDLIVDFNESDRVFENGIEINVEEALNGNDFHTGINPGHTVGGNPTWIPADFLKALSAIARINSLLIQPGFTLRDQLSQSVSKNLSNQLKRYLDNPLSDGINSGLRQTLNQTLAHDQAAVGSAALVNGSGRFRDIALNAPGVHSSFSALFSVSHGLSQPSLLNTRLNNHTLF